MIGIRILDKKNHVVSVSITDILKNIDGIDYYWSILYLDVAGNLGEGKSVPEFEETVENSPSGFVMSWEKLNKLAHRFDAVEDILIIGCKNKNDLQRFDNDSEMCKECDYVIEMFDSCYWSVYTKDPSVLYKLATKFNDTKYLCGWHDECK